MRDILNRLEMNFVYEKQLRIKAVSLQKKKYFYALPPRKHPATTMDPEALKLRCLVFLFLVVLLDLVEHIFHFCEFFFRDLLLRIHAKLQVTMRRASLGRHHAGVAIQRERTRRQREVRA
jgi:hypothetical protein